MITLSFFIAGILTGVLGLAVGMPVGVLLALNINQLLHGIEKVVNGILLVVYKLFSSDSTAAVFTILNPSYYLEKIPVNLHKKELLLIALMCIVLSAVVSIIPSSRAGKEKPLDIMRKL